MQQFSKRCLVKLKAELIVFEHPDLNSWILVLCFYQEPNRLSRWLRTQQVLYKIFLIFLLEIGHLSCNNNYKSVNCISVSLDVMKGNLYDYSDNLAIFQLKLAFNFTLAVRHICLSLSLQTTSSNFYQSTKHGPTTLALPNKLFAITDLIVHLDVGRRPGSENTVLTRESRKHRPLIRGLPTDPLQGLPYGLLHGLPLNPNPNT